MEIGVSGPIFNHKRTKSSMEQKYPYDARSGEIVSNLFFELEPFLYSSVFIKQLNLSNVYIYSHVSTRIHPLKTSDDIFYNDTHTIQYGIKILW